MVAARGAPHHTTLPPRGAKGREAEMRRRRQGKHRERRGDGTLPTLMHSLSEAPTHRHADSHTSKGGKSRHRPRRLVKELERQARPGAPLQSAEEGPCPPPQGAPSAHLKDDEPHARGYCSEATVLVLDAV